MIKRNLNFTLNINLLTTNLRDKKEKFVFTNFSKFLPFIFDIHFFKKYFSRFRLAIPTRYRILVLNKFNFVNFENYSLDNFFHLLVIFSVSFLILIVSEFFVIDCFKILINDFPHNFGV